MAQSISISRLAAILGIDRPKVVRLFKPLNSRKRPFRISHKKINARLAHPSVAIGFPDDGLPTIQRLAAGQLTLVTTGTAITLTPFSKHTLANSGIPYIRLTRRSLRYSVSGIAVAKWRQGLSSRQVTYILGMGRKGWDHIQQHIVQPGLLTATENPLDKRTLLVPRTEVARLLASRLLPSWIDAEDWIEYRLATFGTPNETTLWTMAATGQALGADRKEVRRLLDEQQLDYIWTPTRKERRITPDSVQRYLKEGPIPQGVARPPLMRYVQRSPESSGQV